MTSTADLLIRTVSHDDFRRLRQQDFAIFRKVLDRLPVTYGKSAKDKLRPLADILKEAERPDSLTKPGESPDSERGREAGTVNRHFTHLNALLKFAAGYGVSCAEKIDLSFFAEPAPERARDDRPPMTDDDIKALLRAPVWLGCAGERERLAAGDVGIHDALYWARADRDLHAGAAGGDLRAHDRRSPLRRADLVFSDCAEQVPPTQNVQSIREVPIHPELLRLGLRAYVEAIRPRLLSAVSRTFAGERKRAAGRSVS